MSDTASLENYTKFTPEMKSTHKLLIPQMSPIHFEMIADIIRQDGYDVEILENTGDSVIHDGLQYVHNDACYPALLVIGQFIDAINSGKYDREKTALLITQTGGGCRASNYIYMLRKALKRAGLDDVPVASLNFSGLDSGSSLKVSLKAMRKSAVSMVYGDCLLSISNQVRPYENNVGETEQMVSKWIKILNEQFAQTQGLSRRKLRKNIKKIADDFSTIPTHVVKKTKVGIVGEIYVKYSPFANNDLVDFLIKEGCEVNVPGLLGFIQYCIINTVFDHDLYGGDLLKKYLYGIIYRYTAYLEKAMTSVLGKSSVFKAPAHSSEVIKLADRFIGLGSKMGEGWLLTGEMAELVKSGYPNIICAQPFGCLPNHVVGKAMISKIRAYYPTANIMPIDYDPSATKVNQENRIKLMLAAARKTQGNVHDESEAGEQQNVVASIANEILGEKNDLQSVVRTGE